ncbi:MAG: alpha-galactosidase [Hyphomonadaceae bacterium]
MPNPENDIRPANRDNYVSLVAHETSLILACQIGTRPRILHWGPILERTTPQQLELMATRQHAHGGPDLDISASLMNDLSSGIGGHSGLLAHRAGKDWGTACLVEGVELHGSNAVTIKCKDNATQIRVTHKLGLAPDSGVLTCQTRVTNMADTPLTIDWCAALCLPIDERANRLIGFTGRWAGEFNTENIPLFTGSYVRENKSGRTSHCNFPGLILASQTTDESQGLAIGLHLGWSGNNTVRADRLSDGRTFAQMGEYFFPGEMQLGAGQHYDTPILYAAITDQGLSALSQKFHSHLRQDILSDSLQEKPRPVHYNTWEAVYFNHDQATLFELADKAAEVGAERFVLDDGWFGGRRNDRTGLGDWWVSQDVYPEGLTPLIGKVTELGMEFGLWLEPEMVNPDSELYRAHPDWILQLDGVEHISSRGQYALDLTRPDVTEYLHSKINSLLLQNNISYIKWDMNRDIHHPASGGHAVISKQTRALYDLLRQLRNEHPRLEIETCASGGGRADYGILKHTDRIWTSDSNDALDRQRIQRGASHFFPLEIMGAHVGPRTCHITGRKLSMELRVATAFFGHMGMELNLLNENPNDLDILKAGIQLHKTHRTLLHSGAFYRLDTPPHINAVAVVSDAKTEALVSWVNLTGHEQTLPGKIFFFGLDPKRYYRTTIIWPSPAGSRTSPSIIETTDLNGAGTVLSGAALMNAGLQTPLLDPETALIYHLVSE